MKWKFNDGGRSASGRKGFTGDCVCRAVAIATGEPYGKVYDLIACGVAAERKTKHRGASGKQTASRGVHVRRKWFRDYMRSLGFKYTPTMGIGTGCRVHLAEGELPMGRLIVQVSGHYTAVIDGVIHDLFDPQRETHVIEADTGRELRSGEWRNVNGICRIARRCVYGFWSKI